MTSVGKKANIANNDDMNFCQVKATSFPEHFASPRDNGFGQGENDVTFAVATNLEKIYWEPSPPKSMLKMVFA